MITTLAGGVGAAKLLDGLSSIVPPEELTIIVNTGDDCEFHGLHISPDIDIIIYTLAGLVDEEKGWGIKNDTFNCLEMLKVYGHDTWFKLGDRDLATHIHRTMMLKSGYRLSEVTKDICTRLGLKQRIIPMTDDYFATKIRTDNETMHFQEYLVKRGSVDVIREIVYDGSENAKPAPGVIESIMEAEIVIICPSNPLVSIGTILAVKGVRQALRNTKAKKVAVSPIIGGTVVKGPADKMMRHLGIEVSALGVAKLYADFLDIFVMDEVDAALMHDVERLGIKAVTTNTLMKTKDDRVRLAKFVLDAALMHRKA
ncbi:MAG: 2-phospho-L-lactate transferase [Thaumarchaeota archaeon]|jgi:LPPG:FO 2-phospho-L-lactate transferase|nr:2-phospho-L-lactate transferase [Candidatus Terraquivivens yellowstonensis]MCL7387385.1 2-phospho-L-lactate transferase [Candidatus Terraquivivens yellowstonensis]MCL7392043.1 2-phospho-L-lactate transferase [Candidatus Terraquivivens yellowstonensis]MCL7397799.1 2-phospho-L-lactate transferase [Candidatus Terraquivivens yellowstonensis]MCL7400005.1 2-phospho-L-lactate transferase [Candidatus Terraquivivens yellowstonensis]